MFLRPPKLNQQIFFDNGQAIWIRNIKQVEVANMIHIRTENGQAYMVNPKRVLYVRLFKGDDYKHMEDGVEISS